MNKATSTMPEWRAFAEDYFGNIPTYCKKFAEYERGYGADIVSNIIDAEIDESIYDFTEIALTHAGASEEAYQMSYADSPYGDFAEYVKAIGMETLAKEMQDEFNFWVNETFSYAQCLYFGRENVPFFETLAEYYIDYANCTYDTETEQFFLLSSYEEGMAAEEPETFNAYIKSQK